MICAETGQGLGNCEETCMRHLQGMSEIVSMFALGLQPFHLLPGTFMDPEVFG